MAFFRSLIERREFSLQRWTDYLDSRDAGLTVNDDSALGLSVVWGCIQVKSQDMAKVPLPTYRRTGDDEREMARNHYLWPLFSVAANPYMTAYTFRQTMEYHLAVRGNAYALIERDRLGRVTALWPRLPSHMEPKVEGGRLFYRYHENAGHIDYLPEQVLHLKGMSKDGITGLSPVEVFCEGIALAMAQQTVVAKTMANGARIPFAIEVPQDVGVDQALLLARSFAEAYGGPVNAGKAPFLYGGMKAVELGFSSKDAEILESRRFSVEEFCRIWRIPPYKVMDFLRATFSNVTETNIAYVNDTLRPEQEMWEQSIHMQLLLPEERAEYYVEHDNYDLLKGTPKERAEVECLYTRNGISQVDEVRKSHNWGPVKGGKQNLVQGQMIALENAGNQAVAPQQPKQKGGTPDETGA